MSRERPAALKHPARRSGTRLAQADLSEGPLAIVQEKYLIIVR
jgi:hypothetical protein